MRDPAVSASSVKPRASTSPARVRASASSKAAASVNAALRGFHAELVALHDAVCSNAAKDETDDQLLAEICGSVGTTNQPRAIRRASARAAFKLIDKNGDGVLSRIEVVKALRTSAKVQKLLQLPAIIRQEDGTRDEFERVFQAIDADNNKQLTLQEFERYVCGEAHTPLQLLASAVATAVPGLLLCGTIYAASQCGIFTLT